MYIDLFFYLKKQKQKKNKEKMACAILYLKLEATFLTGAPLWVLPA